MTFSKHIKEPSTLCFSPSAHILIFICLYNVCVMGLCFFFGCCLTRLPPFPQLYTPIYWDFFSSEVQMPRQKQRGGVHDTLNGQILTVARSFWVRPLFWRPSWITFPTSRGTLWWLSSSVSLSSLAVFLVITCCLFCPAAPWKTKLDYSLNPIGNINVLYTIGLYALTFLRSFDFLSLPLSSNYSLKQKHY